MGYARLWVTEVGKSAAYCDHRKHYWEKMTVNSQKFHHSPDVTMFYFGRSTTRLSEELKEA